jgi:hypothetical protein
MYNSDVSEEFIMKIFVFIKNAVLSVALLYLTVALTLFCIANIGSNIQKNSAFLTILKIDFNTFFKLNICVFMLATILLFVIKIIKNNFNLTKYLKYSVTISFVISCGLYFDLTEFIAISSFVTFGISICKFMFRDQACEETNSN